MTNVAHKDLTDPNLHEPKGAGAAAANSIYVANGGGSGSWKLPIIRATATLSPASVAANTTAEQLFTISGVALATDVVVSVSKPTAQAGLGIVGWRVSADNQVGITFSNNTGSPIVPTASQVYTIILNRN